MATPTENKVNNTFNRVMDEINRLQKAFQPASNLERAISDLGGDIAWLKDVNKQFDELYNSLEEAHYGAMAHLEMGESIKLPKSREVNESVLDASDDDGFMARSQLYFLAKDAIQLHGMIDDRQNLEGWVQSKIAQAAQGIDAVRRYTEYNTTQGNQEVPVEVPQEEVGVTEQEEDYDIVDTKTHNINNAVALAGDSIWADDNPETVNVKKIVVNKQRDGYIDVKVEHDGPWEIYTDSGFAKNISALIGIEVDFSEQGMQEPGMAHLESMEDIKEAKKKNCGCGQDPCKTYGKQEVKESKKDEKFEPHMMYDPKTGEGKMAKVEKDHIDWAKKGWVHEKPKKSDLKENDMIRFQAMATQKKNQKKRDEKEKKMYGAKADMDMRAKGTLPKKESAEEVHKSIKVNEHDTALLMKVADQIKQDANTKRFHEIDELLKDVPTEVLQSYLSNASAERFLAGTDKASNKITQAAKDKKNESADKHSEKICKDTVRNPNKELLGGPTAKQAEKMLKDKFGYSDAKIAKLKKEGIEFDEKRSVALKTVAVDMVKKAKESAKKAAK